MDVLELSCRNIEEFKQEIGKIPQEKWDSVGFIYGPTDIPGMFQIYKDTRNLSRTKLVNYQELDHLKQAYESNLDI